MRAILTIWAVLLVLPTAAWADDLTPERRRELTAKVEALTAEAGKLYPQGAYVKASELMREALLLTRQLYPKEQYPNGHSDLADRLADLGTLIQLQGRYPEAEPFTREALAMRQRLFPRDKFPDGHIDIAESLSTLAALLQMEGLYTEAEPLTREALAMRRKLFSRANYPDGHDELATSINNLATLLQAQGEYARAEPLHREALEMRKKLFPADKYPDGHPYIAESLSNLGTVLQAQRQYARAEEFYREALAMRRKLYPKDKFPVGHPNLALSLSTLGYLFQEQGQHAEAEKFFRATVDMNKGLYPEGKFFGHPDLARCWNNLAFVLAARGDYGSAGPLYRDAVAMWRRLYPPASFPDGHDNLVRGLTNQAALFQAQGKHDQAEPLLREAVGIFLKLAGRHADLAPEAEALNYLATFPDSRDRFLACGRHLAPDPSAYDLLFGSKAHIARVQERRHRDLMASRDKDTADLADQLRQARLSLSGLLLRPGRNLEPHRTQVQKLTEAKEDLEKRIAARLRLVQVQAATSPTPKQLAEALPRGSAFVDLYRYIDVEQDSEVRGKKGETRTPRYAAFVLRKDKPATRIELKEAVAIDEAWADWHKAIMAARPDDKAERAAAAKVAELVWTPLRHELPADLTTVYLAPEGPLHHVPWAALPGQMGDSILLDECAICLVPHGPFLLERLGQKPSERSGDALVVYGGVDYTGDAAAVLKPHDDVRGPLLAEKKPIKWGELPGTAKEQEQVVALAEKILKEAPVARTGRSANTKQLEADLPKARYAHLATHGFFADAQFRSALQVDPKLFDYGGFGERRGGARSPLVLSGLVLAGANRQGEDAAPDRGIITAEGLIGLRLEGLELAVLSACETGLGEDGGGEGVYGLQRAFHVAGCRDVIASLWKVDDAATQTLMTLFYRNLWEKKLDAAEALRQAQLTLYRHPEAVTVVAKRGVDFTETDLPKVEEKPAEKTKHSPTSHWAAFTFSGVRPVKLK